MLASEVSDVLRDKRTLFGPRDRSYVAIGRTPESDLSDVYGIVVELVAEVTNGSRGEHLVEQEPHASSARRCSAASRPDSIASSLRAMRAWTSFG